MHASTRGFLGLDVSVVLDVWWPEAQRLVTENLWTIISVAKELYEKRRLTGDEGRAIIAKSDPKVEQPEVGGIAAAGGQQ